MFQKIRLRDKDGKDLVGEINIPAKDHLLAQQKYPSKIIKSKKIYNRKGRKNRDYD